jgi:hypothetical protein
MVASTTTTNHLPRRRPAITTITRADRFYVSGILAGLAILAGELLFDRFVNSEAITSIRYPEMVLACYATAAAFWALSRLMQPFMRPFALLPASLPAVVLGVLVALWAFWPAHLAAAALIFYGGCASIDDGRVTPEARPARTTRQTVGPR